MGRNALRSFEIFSAACKYFSGYLFNRMLRRDEKRQLFAKQFRSFLENLGPTFVKFGQLLSIRPDLVPPEVIFELEKLQESVSPFEFKVVQKQIRRELGAPVEKLFEKFEQSPIAAGSVAQAHRAKLKDGTDAIVKILRPEAERIIEADLGLMFALARMVGKIKRLNFIDPVATVEEWSQSLHRELDFRVEGRHADRFKFIFRNDPLMVVPKIFWELTGKRVLTMEYIEGFRLTDLGSAERKGIDTYALAEHGARVFIKEVLEDGFFHGDLHPSNILITPDGRIAYLDFGIVGKIGDYEKKVLARMTVAIIEQNVEEIVKQAKLLGVEIDSKRIPAMKGDLGETIDRYLGKSLGEIKIDNLGKELLAMLYRRKVRIPRNYVLLAKAMITVEGVAKGLYPDFNIINVARPYLFTLVSRSYPSVEMITDIIQRILKSKAQV